MDRLDDGALGDAGAAAHGDGVFHLGDGFAAVRLGLREQQIAAAHGEIGVVAQPVHVAIAVGRIAHQHHARQAVVAHQQLLVDAEGGIFVAHDFGAFGLGEVAGREDVDAHDLEFGGGLPSLEHGTFVAGDRGGQHFALFEERRDQSVDLAVVLHAFAHGEDARVARSPCGR